MIKNSENPEDFYRGLASSALAFLFFLFNRKDEKKKKEKEVDNGLNQSAHKNLLGRVLDVCLLSSPSSYPPQSSSSLPHFFPSGYF